MEIGENAGNQHFLLFPYCCCLFCPGKFLPFNPSPDDKFKQSADDNFEIDKNTRKFFKWVENTVGKGEIARDEEFLLFSSTGRRPASYCHGVVTSCVRPSVRPFVRACVRKLFL